MLHLQCAISILQNFQFNKFYWIVVVFIKTIHRIGKLSSYLYVIQKTIIFQNINKYYELTSWSYACTTTYKSTINVCNNADMILVIAVD